MVYGFFSVSVCNGWCNITCCCLLLMSTTRQLSQPHPDPRTAGWRNGGDLNQRDAQPMTLMLFVLINPTRKSFCAESDFNLPFPKHYHQIFPPHTHTHTPVRTPYLRVSLQSTSSCSRDSAWSGSSMLSPSSPAFSWCGWWKSST